MNKNKNLLVLGLLIAFGVGGFSAYQIYKRVNLHLYGDSLEVNPKPVDLPETKAQDGGKTEAETAKAEKIQEDPKTFVKEEKKPENQAAKASEEKKNKAVKTLFEYKAKKAKKVFLSGSFSKWKEIPMKGGNGLWTTEVYILPGNYFYHFVVDGKKTLDSKNPKTPMGESLVMVK